MKTLLKNWLGITSLENKVEWYTNQATQIIANLNEAKKEEAELSATGRKVRVVLRQPQREEVIASKASYRNLARKYKVSVSTISKIKTDYYKNKKKQEAWTSTQTDSY